MTISRKQVNVIFRNVKEGNVEASKEVISKMYYLADAYLIESVDRKECEGVRYLLKAVDDIFKGDFEMANLHVGCFEDVYC